ncbi:MAG: hypothetical protein MJ082_01485 [Clostridia bacterium]|nr:hypothetical protein [Clostridia bacterium]
MWKSDKPVLSFLKNGKGLPRVILLIALGILLLWLGSGKLKTAEPPDRSATEELCENVQSRRDRRL